MPVNSKKGFIPSPKFGPILCCHREAGGEYPELPMGLFTKPRWNRKQQSKFGAGFTPSPKFGLFLVPPRLSWRNRANEAFRMFSLDRGKQARLSKFGAGFTLLETIVALAIITAAAVGPVVLITRGILSFGFSKNKLIAVNLTQEGIELVREIRENNVLCDNLNGSANWDWFKDPDGSGVINSGSFETDIIATQPLTGCGSASIRSPSLAVFANTTLKLNAATGMYSYSEPLPTIFTREIIIDKPPADGGIPANAQRDVTSVVRWTERGIARNVTLQERFYDWR